jgi:pimeloyl-ACP methyl ester carboxylesterase/DNA-binding CsgD family transcriptional regulator
VPSLEPRTRYAITGDGAHIAFHAVGDASVDLVIVPGLASHLELQWEDPAYRSFVRKLATFARVITFDKRGTGLSDPAAELPDLDQRVDDLIAVMTAANASRPFVLGYSEGGPIAMKFASEHPDLLRGLVLYGTSPRNPPDWAVEQLRGAIDVWGSGASIALFAPSQAGDPVAREKRARFERAAASPSMARAIVDALALVDVRPLLGSIEVPTLVVHREGDLVPIGDARYTAAHIAGARLAELPGTDHIPWVGDTDAVVDVVEEFVRSHAPQTAPVPRSASGARRAARPSTGWHSLTEREADVAMLVAEGASNPEIAQRLFISRQTVESHLKHIFSKLAVESRAAVAAEAVRRKSTPNT